jgi:hypothetical protein
MAKVRLLNTKPKKKGNTPTEWTRLFRETLARAERLGDSKRVQKLRAGAQNPADTLKRMSIISKADLDREFPLPEK